MKVTKYRGTLNKTHRNSPHRGMIESNILGSINIEKFGICDVIIKNLETTDIPHFHIIDSNNETVCCIEMFKAKYYRGHSKDKHIKLSLEECILLNNIMDSQQPIFENESRWEFSRGLWSGYDNDETNWSMDFQKPDYTKLRKRR